MTLQCGVALMFAACSATTGAQTRGSMPNPVPWDVGLELCADEHARVLHPVDPADFDVGELTCEAVWSPGQPRPGPENLEAIMAWPWHAAQRVLQHAACEGVDGFEGSLRAVLANVQVTSSYSGMGCAEGVLPLLRDALLSLGISAIHTFQRNGCVT